MQNSKCQSTATWPLLYILQKLYFTSTTSLRINWQWQMHIRCHLVMICTHNLNLTLAGPIMDALSHYVRTFSATGCILMMSIPHGLNRGCQLALGVQSHPRHTVVFISIIFCGNLLNYYLTYCPPSDVKKILAILGYFIFCTLYFMVQSLT